MIKIGANGNKKTTESFRKEVDLKTNGEYELVGEYKLSNISVEIKHNLCNKVFLVKPVNFIRNNKYTRCPYCSTANNKKKTTLDFINSIKEIVGDEYSVIGEYNGNKEKIQMLHKKCNKSFYMKPNHFLGGERCPYCMSNHSKMEDIIKNYIVQEFPQYTVKTTRKRTKNNKLYEIDIFIEEIGIGFEYNGTYWHSTLQKVKDYHKNKQKELKDIGITIYFLWEHWGQDMCLNIINDILSQRNILYKEPYIEFGTKYLYANKDLFPISPPIIDGYKFIKEVIRKKDVKIGNKHNFEIYNSGYYKYIKQ